jgi:hypothetical protein
MPSHACTASARTCWLCCTSRPITVEVQPHLGHVRLGHPHRRRVSSPGGDVILIPPSHIPFVIFHTNYIIQVAFDTTRYIPFVILHIKYTRGGVKKRLERSCPGMALLGKPGLLLKRGEFNKGPNKRGSMSIMWPRLFAGSSTSFDDCVCPVVGPVVLTETCDLQSRVAVGRLGVSR